MTSINFLIRSWTCFPLVHPAPLTCVQVMNTDWITDIKQNTACATDFIWFHQDFVTIVIKCAIYSDKWLVIHFA
jgi:hypothetical protein